MSEVHTPAPPVERTIHGKLTGVEMRNAGWHRFSILEPGNQYPYRADTKKKDLIDQAMSLMNADVSVQVQERKSDAINEHTGEPFTNKYLNAIAMQGSGTFAQGQGGTSGGQQTPTTQQANPIPNVVQPGVSGYDKDLTIWRQTAAKVVGSIYASLPPAQQNIEGVVQASEALVAYFIYGPARFGVQAFNAGIDPEKAVEQIDRMLYTQPGAQRLIDAGMDAEKQSEEEFIRSLGEIAEGEPCPSCGFVGTHSLGCPEADFAT